MINKPAFPVPLKFAPNYCNRIFFCPKSNWIIKPEIDLLQQNIPKAKAFAFFLPVCYDTSAIF